MISEDKDILAKSKDNLIYLYNFIFNGNLIKII